MPIVSYFPLGGETKNGTFMLSPVTGISSKAGTQTTYIKWTDPEDLLLDDGRLLASWAGTLLIRKAGAPVQGRHDGTIVLDNKNRNAYSQVWFQDSGLTDGITYYYQFFPYTSGGAYTFNYENAFSLTPGSVFLDGVSNLTAENAGGCKINLTWTDPAATIEEDGIMLAKWNSTKVVYKEGSYPTSSIDGTMAANVMSYNAHQTAPLTVTVPEDGKTYYFALFPTTLGGVETSSQSGQIACASARFKVDSLPSTNDVLVYDGNQLAPTWIGYESDKMSISGDTYGVDAGEYSTVFALDDDYCWPDGSTEPYEYKWNIATLKVDVPSCANSIADEGGLIYTGGVLAPEWVGYDPETTVMTGDLDGVGAGEYSTIFTLMDNCEWNVGGTDPVTIRWVISKAITQKPAVVGTYIYNGSEQTAVLDGYDANAVELTGDFSATNAGTYVINATTDANHMWEDGSVLPAAIEWSIGKAAGEWGAFICERYTDLTAERPEKTYTLSSNSMDEAELSVWSEDESVVGIELADEGEHRSVIVTAKENGSTTVHFQFKESANFTATYERIETLDIDLTPHAVVFTAPNSEVVYEDGINDVDPAILAEWAAAIAENEEVSNETSEIWLHYGTMFRHISVGDQTIISIGGAEYAFGIIGFNHDILSDNSGVAGITLEMDEVWPTPYKMYASATNMGGWKNSAIRTTNVPELKAMMPMEWKALIKTISKNSDTGGVPAMIQALNEDLFILCEEEIFGTASNGYAGEGEQYALYRAGNSVIKSTGGAAQSRLTRTSKANSSSAFVGVDAAGESMQVDASVECYIAVAFCI